MPDHQGPAPLSAVSDGDEDILTRKEHLELYADRVKVFPKAVSGQVRQMKWLALCLMLGAYYLVPWLRWDRGEGVPNQAVLLDMEHRRAYFFWLEIWPQELYILTFLLFGGALLLFMATAMFGRVWCGYACPQTVWTDLFMFVERRIEGDRNARMKLDRAPWTMDKWRKKLTKHAIWIGIAFATGGAWVMYFTDAPTFVWHLLTFRVGFGTLFFMALFTATTYLLAGIAREQVCTYMCPWPRFQAAMLDKDSYVVTYDKARGEPRGKHHRGDSWNGRGDCIDCRQCVAVCPTGIDIRDGIQLECIGCGLCIDACNGVMEKVERPMNLIGFYSERDLELKAEGKPAASRLIRPRTMIYAGVLGAVGLLIVTLIGTRATIDLNVMHDRNPLFVRLSDGDIRNGYTMNIINRSHDTRTFTIAADGLDDALLADVRGGAGETLTVTVAPDQVLSHRLFITTAGDAAGRSGERRFDFRITDVDGGESTRERSSLHGPRR